MAISVGCTRLVGGDLVVLLTPGCIDQLANDAGKQAFQGVVRAEVDSLEPTGRAGRRPNGQPRRCSQPQ